MGCIFMIIIEKKKILYIVISVAMVIFVYLITRYNISKKGNIETIQTVALPVDNKVIIVDAGHGKPDEGAQSSNRNNRSGK